MTEETTEQPVPVATLAHNAGIVARDTVGYTDLPDYAQKTVDAGVHIARQKIRSGLTVEQVPVAVEKAELMHQSILATLAAFADGTEPSGDYAKAAEWGNV